MASFKIVEKVECSDKWTDASKFNCQGRIVNKQGKAVDPAIYKGRCYQIIAKKERDFTNGERVGRVFAGILLTIISLGGMLALKQVGRLFTEEKKKVRFGVLYAPPPAVKETPAVTEMASVTEIVANKEMPAVKEIAAIIEVKKSIVFDLESKLVNPNPKHELISFKSLEKEGLLPKYSMKYANATYYFSDTFTYYGSNLLKIMLVEVDGQVHPRIIYQSNSQGVWRVMPLLSKGFNQHIGKGNIESDTQLPLEVNLALHALTGNKPPLNFFKPVENLVKTEEFGKLQHDSWNQKVNVKSFIGLKTEAPKNFFKAGMNVPRPPNPLDVKPPKDPGLFPDISKPLKVAQIEVAL